MRKKLVLSGDHAKVRLLKKNRQKRIGFNPRQRIVKRVSYQQLSPTYTAAMLLAHILYPKNFAKPIASGLDRKTIFSNFVELGKKSQEAINAYYIARHMAKQGNANVNEIRKKFDKYAHEIHQASMQKTQEIINESGITANYLEMNIGVDKKGNFVFFEIMNIEIPKLERKVNSLPEGLEKQQALKLLAILKQEAGEKEIIFAHQRNPQQK